MSMNEKLVIDPVSKNFIIARLLWVIALVWIFAYVFVTGKTLSEWMAQDIFYDENDLTLGLVIKEADKSAFESLTDKDIEKQFNDVVWNLNINKVNYSINTRNIWVNDPFKTGDTPGNKYIDKDLKQQIEATKTNAAANINNANAQIQ